MKDQEEQNLLNEVVRILSSRPTDQSFYQILKNASQEMFEKISQTPALKFHHQRNYKFLLGFKEFEKYRKYYSLKNFKLTKYPLITEFALLLIKINNILESLESASKKKFFNRFTKKYLKESLVPIQAEVEAYITLQKLQFKELNIPDLIQEGSYDLSGSKEEIKFNGEIKSLNRMAGHPIISEAADKFGSYISLEFLDQNFESSCVIEYYFQGKLIKSKNRSQDNLPSELAEKFCEDVKNYSSRIKIRKIKDNNDMEKIYEETKESQSGFLWFKTSPAKRRYIIKLISDQANTYCETIKQRIEDSIKKFKEFGEGRPSLIFLYLENHTHHINNSNVQLTLKHLIKPFLDQDFPLAIIIFSDLKLKPTQEGYKEDTPCYGISNNHFIPYTHLFGDIFKEKLTEF